jgi:hypothetical protein
LVGSRESGTGSLSIVEKDAAPVVSFAAVIERPDDPGATSVSQRAVGTWGTEALHGHAGAGSEGQTVGLYGSSGRADGVTLGHRVRARGQCGSFGRSLP